jgi:hypothetical protein
MAGNHSSDEATAKEEQMRVLESHRMFTIRYAICLTVLLSGLSSAQQPQTTTQEANSYLREASITQTEHTIHIVANSPRPLAQIVDALHLKYGWVIDYEDPRYSSQLDIVERPGVNGMHLSLPAGGAFSADVPAGDPTTEPPPEDKTLQAILDAYDQSKNPGRFGLRKNEDGSFALVGIGAADEKGKIAVQEAALDLAITIPTAQRSATATLNLILEKLAAQSHGHFTLGVTPRRLLDYTDVKVGGTKVQARMLLASALQATGHTMYWHLLFDPGSKGYFLDIHAVPPKK